jgi:hypothetical protein
MTRDLTSKTRVLKAIVLVRGQKVILDADLASLYGVSTKALVQAVKRNRGRFPKDFMFLLSKSEISNLRSQTVTSSSWGGRRTAPYAFTEHGVAMLSTVLRSRRAITVNIEIMRAFVTLRRMLEDHRDLARRIDDLEKRYDESFEAVFEAIRTLIATKSEPAKRIGYLRASS